MFLSLRLQGVLLRVRCLAVLVCFFAVPVHAQIAVPTFGTRGGVPEALLTDFMIDLRTAIARDTGRQVTIGELITPGIAGSLDPDLVFTIAELDGARFGLSGEIRVAAPGQLQAPYVLSVMIGDVETRRTSDLISEPLSDTNLAVVASEVAAVVAMFVSADQQLALGEAGLFVSSQPSNARVLVNGIESGLTASMDVLMLEPGLYDIEIRKEGYLPAQRRVELKTGLTEMLNVPLTPIAGGSLQVISTPRANVRLDGREVGQTPLTVQALPGTHVVQLWRLGFETITLDTPVRDYRVSRVEQLLQPSAGTVLYWDAAPEQLVFIDGSLQIRAFLAGLEPGVHTLEVRTNGITETHTFVLPLSGTYRLELSSGALELFGQ